MDAYGIVYKITNIVNQKVYFGQTVVSLSKRWSQHQSLAKNNQRKTHLYNAIREDGIESFICEEVTQFFTKEELDKAEIELIQQHKSFDRNFGYNLALGGNNGGKRTQETKAKISASQVGKSLTQEHKIALSLAHKGIPSCKKGIPLSNEQKSKISGQNHWNLGGISPMRDRTYIRSEESKLKQSLAQRGKKRGSYKKRVIGVEGEPDKSSQPFNKLPD